MEKRTGLLRCYVSSIEHSHTVPSVDTLERIARALDVPLYSLFHEGSEARLQESQLPRRAQHRAERGSDEDRRFLRLLRRHVRHLDEHRRGLLLFMARTMARMAADEKARNGQ